MTTISRAKLYEKVWSHPMTKVAAEVGVTGTALTKTCARHNIPIPERGYWAKLQHGKPIKTDPLPATSNPALDEVHISGGFHQAALGGGIGSSNSGPRQLGAARGGVGSESGPYRPGAEILDATRRAATKAKVDVSVRGRGGVPLTIAPGSVERSSA